MAGFKLTGLGSATVRTDAIQYAQVQDGSPTYLTGTAGTNTVTASAANSMSAYATGQSFSFIPANTNTGATTLNINSIGAKNVYSSGIACIGGELRAGVPVSVFYDGTQFNILESGQFSSVMNSGSSMNVGISASVGSSALTISLKGRDLNDPSDKNVVLIPFRNATVTTGDVSWLAVNAATSLVISSGSTMGTRNGIPFRVWIVGFNDAGTFRLGAINCLTTVAGAGAGSDVTSIYPLSAWGIASSTAEGGAGAADSAGVFYTGTAVTSKAYTVLGYITFESGQATAGTWASSASRTQIYGPSIPLPGQVVQVARNDTGAVATGTTVMVLDDTIPQNTEGDQYLAQAVTPSSAANVLTVESQLMLTNSAGASQAMVAAVYQDSTANALAAVNAPASSNAFPDMYNLKKRILAATGSATTLKVRAGCGGAGTTTFNGRGGARDFGGVINSYIEITEVMG